MREKVRQLFRVDSFSTISAEDGKTHTKSGSIARPPLYSRRRSRQGASLLEVLFSLTIFGLVLIMFSAALPQTLRGSGKSANYLQAALLGRHKIDQLRVCGYNHLNAADLLALGVTDSATANTDGSYSFSNVDHLVTNGAVTGYFGAATNATGTLLIGQALSGQGASAPNTRWVKQVTITIQWTGGGVNTGSFTTHTVIATP